MEETVRRYTDATTITQRMVAELINHIDVYHAEKHDGITTQQWHKYITHDDSFSAYIGDILPPIEDLY